MEPIKYISDFYSSTKFKSSIDQHLSLFVDLNVYNQFHDFFLNRVDSNKKNYVASLLCKMYFLIYYLNYIGIRKISNEVFEYSISRNHSQLAWYKQILVDSYLISRNTHLNTYIKDGIKCISQEIDEYIVYPVKVDQEHSSILKEIDYYIIDKSIFKSIVKSYHNNKLSTTTINPPIPYIVSTHSLGDIGFQQFTTKMYTIWYSQLQYLDLTNNIDIVETEKLQKSICYLHDDNRYYHVFHSYPSSIRNSRILFDNEKLVEAFDVHNCQHVLMNCLFDDSISTEEKDRFYNITVSGKFYEDIRDWVNHNYGSNWSREDAKLFSNSYYNIKNKSLERALNSSSSKYITAVCIDKYFEINFPEIRNFIYEHKETLHNELNRVETTIMVNNICKDLYEKHGIKALTVHDALYVKETDLAIMRKRGISAEKMFFECISCFKLL